MARSERSSRRRAGSSKKSRKLTIDWTGVDTSGKGKGFRIPEGEYAMQVESVERAESKEGNDMLAWIFLGTEGKAKGKKFYYYTTLTPESLWKLGGLLTHLGVEVPDSEDELDLDELIDLECMGVVQDSEYDDKITSKLVDTFPIDGEAGETDKSDKKGKKGKKDDEEKVSASEVRDMDEDELADLVKEKDLEVDLDEHKSLRRKAAAVIAELEEKELLEDE